MATCSLEDTYGGMTMRRDYSKLAVFVVAGAVASGCGKMVEPPAIQNRLQMESFQSCEDLEQYIENTAVEDMRFQLDAMKEGGWLFSRGGFDAQSSPGGAANGEKAAAPSAYTKTNTQVQGVDEADFVKNDGTRIFVLSGQKLYAAKSWPATDLALASALTIEGYPQSMYLDEQSRVVVLSSIYSKYPDDQNAGGESPCAADAWGCGYSYANSTKVTVVDMTTLAAPKVIAEHYLPGSANQSRRIGSSVRVVLSDYFRWPATVRFYPDYDGQNPDLWNDQAVLGRKLDELKIKNEQIIRARTLTQWLPKARRRVGNGAVVDVAYACTDFYKTNAPVRLGLMTIATLNLDHPEADIARTSLVAEPGQIFASATSLYLASQHWWWWPSPGQRDFTYIHKFDITDPDRAIYVASGGVDGHFLNQFSMDEYKGYFRVATTIATRVFDTENRWGRTETTNRVHVLNESKGALQVIGQTEELAKGERITSARFVEEKGFVVTYRQTDPLYTIDLSNPADPRTIGELKVPGFSTYIHPIDANHLLTIGVYLPDPGPNGQTDWQKRSMKLTVFDVTDFKNPKEQHTALVGTANGWSEAAWEHKAFNYFPEKKLLAIPFSDYLPNQNGDNYWGSFVSELRVFDIDLEKGIKQRGAVSLKDIYQHENDYSWQWYWSPWVRRSVMASDDQGNDFVYAISDGGIRVANAKNMAQPLATVRFQKAGR
ncbi:MAG: hypothetical protein EXR72_05845 [Myxococcales bacterium]|nr:hypothetical protein [Myxococcales bacterium]